MSRTVDINCDLGEGYGIWQPEQDAQLMPHISSGNVACGYHAGDPRIMHRTVGRCRDERVSVGAHISYPDRPGFGRRHMRCTEDEIYTDALYQIGALAAICRAQGMELAHVKPHGALYHDALHNEEVAIAVVRAVHSFDPELYLYAPPNTMLTQVAEAMGIRVAVEAFLDRGYRPDGTLVPRSEPGAVITDPQQVARRVQRLLAEGVVEAVDGTLLPLASQTLCLHSDTPGVAALAEAAARAVAAAGLELAPPWWR